MVCSDHAGCAPGMQHRRLNRKAMVPRAECRRNLRHPPPMAPCCGVSTDESHDSRCWQKSCCAAERSVQTPRPLATRRAISSVVEHFFHTEGAAGSNPASRTIRGMTVRSAQDCDRPEQPENRPDEGMLFLFPVTLRTSNAPSSPRQAFSALRGRCVFPATFFF